MGIVGKQPSISANKLNMGANLPCLIHILLPWHMSMK